MQKRRQADVRSRDGWDRGGGASEPERGLAVRKDEDDVCVWKAGGVAGVDKRLEVGAWGRVKNQSRRTKEDEGALPEPEMRTAILRRGCSLCCLAISGSVVIVWDGGGG